LIWIAFAACVIAVLIAGTKLTRYGDIIADRTGLGGAWVGVVLLASVTSLPELATGISSVALFDVPNIALGDIFGSCMFNLVILAVLDALQRQQPISARVHEGQALSASLGIVLLSIAAVSLTARTVIPAVGWVGIYSPLLIALYIAAMRTVFQYERRRIAKFVEEIAEDASPKGISLRTASIRYAINAAVTVTAAIFLPAIGERIAVQTGLSESFVGSIFIAASTSLPELTVAIAALRLDAADMAVGNIFGSNLFNMAILGIDDIAYLKGPLLENASGEHVISAIAAIAMTAIATVGVTYRIGKKRLPLAWDSLAILITYFAATYILYSQSVIGGH
jgi:cation:H+ antiporter